MFFFNDECDFHDDDQYDLFTLATEIERRYPGDSRTSTTDVNSIVTKRGLRCIIDSRRDRSRAR